MKINEALVPEKVYINSNIENRTWLIGKGDTSFIEYIRKDAFIKKACEFLEDRIAHDSIDYPMAIHWLIDDFRKYMREE